MLNVLRFQAEQREVMKIFGRRFQLYEDTSVSRNRWDRYMYVGKSNRYTITARYHQEHPFQRMNILLNPRPKTHHWYDDSLCYLTDAEWSQNFTAATVLGIAIRFLYENKRGLTE